MADEAAGQVKAAVWTEPDFLLTRSDAQDCDVAIYLDGQIPRQPGEQPNCR